MHMHQVLNIPGEYITHENKYFCFDCLNAQEQEEYLPKLNFLAYLQLFTAIIFNFDPAVFRPSFNS